MYHGNGWYDQDFESGWTSTTRTRRVDKKNKLVLAPLAFLKLQFMCQRGPTEVGGFGITMEKDPLYVMEFMTLPQQASSASFKFNDGAQTDFVMRMAEMRDIHPENSSRIWIHTHPGWSADPSGVDEATLDDDFADQNWVVMMIMAREGAFYARLRHNTGPGGDILLPVEIDWKAFPSLQGTVDVTAEMAAWEDEYTENITIERIVYSYGPTRGTVYNGVRQSADNVPVRVYSHGPAAQVAPGLGVPAAIADSEFKEVKELPAPAAANGTPAKKATATQKMYERMANVETRLDHVETYLEDVGDVMGRYLEHEDMLDYFATQFPDADGSRALENDDEDLDDEDFAALNRLRAEELRDAGLEIQGDYR